MCSADLNIKKRYKRNKNDFTKYLKCECNCKQFKYTRSAQFRLQGILQSVSSRVNSHAGVTLASGGSDEKGDELRATNKAQTKNGSREKAKRPAPREGRIGSVSLPLPHTVTGSSQCDFSIWWTECIQFKLKCSQGEESMGNFWHKQWVWQSVSCQRWKRQAI